MTVRTTTERIIFEGIDRISAAARSGAKSTDQLKGSLDSVKNVLGALGITVGAGLMLKLANDALSAAAALDDMSEMTGISVEKLSGLQRVAKIGGHDFNSLAQQMAKMVKGLKESSAEGGVAANALKYLGINAREADGRFRDMGDLLVDVAKKLNDYEDGGNKLALVNDLLGRGAERYIPYLKDIATGTDNVATLTREQAAAAEEAEKAINRLKVSVDEAKRSLVVDMAPAITKVIDQFNAASGATDSWIRKLQLFFSIGGSQSDNPLGKLEEVEERIAFLQRYQKALTESSAKSFMARMFHSEDLSMLSEQLKFAEQERETLKTLLAKRVSGNAVGLAEDAAGNVGPAPGPARLNYKTHNPNADPDAEVFGELSKKRISAAEIAKRVAEEEERLSRENNELSDKIAKDKIARETAFNETLGEAARYRQRLAEEQERVADEAYQRRIERAKTELSELGTLVETEENYAQRQIDAENARFERQLQNIALLAASREEADSLAETAEAEHQERLTQIADDEEARRWNIRKVHRKLDLDSTKQFFGSMSALMNTNSRKLFEIGKTAAIAETIVNTYSAAMGAYKALASIPYVGPALGAAAAAAAIASGMAQVQAIRAQQFGGGGGAVGTFAANPTTGQPVGTPGGDVGERQTATIVLHGDTYSRKSVRDMFTALNEDMDDGGRFFVVEGR